MKNVNPNGRRYIDSLTVEQRIIGNMPKCGFHIVGILCRTRFPESADAVGVNLSEVAVRRLRNPIVHVLLERVPPPLRA
jgi:hypothetical protein